MYNQILFTNILRLLDEQGMSKQELAIRANMSVSFMSDLTNGKANPSLKVMESIAEALGTTLPFLLESNDLDYETLKELAGGKKIDKSLPDGYVRKSAILTEYQAFMVSQWEEANKKTISSFQKQRISSNAHKKRKLSKEKLEILDVMRKADRAISIQEITKKLLKREGVDETSNATYIKNIYINTHISSLQKLGLVVLSKEKKFNKLNKRVRLWELTDKTNA